MVPIQRTTDLPYLYHKDFSIFVIQSLRNTSWLYRTLKPKSITLFSFFIVLIQIS